MHAQKGTRAVQKWANFSIHSHVDESFPHSGGSVTVPLPLQIECYTTRYFFFPSPGAKDGQGPNYCDAPQEDWWRSLGLQPVRGQGLRPAPLHCAGTLRSWGVYRPGMGAAASRKGPRFSVVMSRIREEILYKKNQSQRDIVWRRKFSASIVNFFSSCVATRYFCAFGQICSYIRYTYVINLRFLKLEKIYEAKNYLNFFIAVYNIFFCLDGNPMPIEDILSHI